MNNRPFWTILAGEIECCPIWPGLDGHQKRTAGPGLTGPGGLAKEKELSQ